MGFGSCNHKNIGRPILYPKKLGTLQVEGLSKSEKTPIVTNALAWARNLDRTSLSVSFFLPPGYALGSEAAGSSCASSHPATWTELLRELQPYCCFGEDVLCSNPAQVSNADVARLVVKRADAGKTQVWPHNHHHHHHLSLKLHNHHSKKSQSYLDPC